MATTWLLSVLAYASACSSQTCPQVLPLRGACTQTQRHMHRHKYWVLSKWLRQQQRWCNGDWNHWPQHATARMCVSEKARCVPDCSCPLWYWHHSRFACRFNQPKLLLYPPTAIFSLTEQNMLVATISKKFKWTRLLFYVLRSGWPCTSSSCRNLQRSFCDRWVGAHQTTIFPPTRTLRWCVGSLCPLVTHQTSV